MDEKKWAAVLASAVLAVGGGLYYYNHRPAPAPVEAAAPAPVPAPEPPAPPPDYPVPAAPADAPPLPQLADSDAGIGAALAELIGKGPFEAFLVPDMLIRRIVATIDNLPRERMAIALRPFKRVPPPLLVDEAGGRTTLATANAERYAGAVALFTAIDASRLAALYFRWYPLFERAYVDLGYPGRSFNNRLVEVLDHLLATSEPPAEIELVRPKLAYEFADPRLESLSAGQKMLLRLSAAQRGAVLGQLRAIRAAVTAGAAASG